ncbi:PEP-CTERM sorting domain-containing protein [Colwellia psychrerythraea]|uniref:PEP motif putative anchor domain protein n=1 Tax=Colwellia psychrerythraea TaxID=28229 RepID=A0A099KG80_COLPS|nr:PEP-CTERM sorting domain-containing protein [Colwellia psychrerythraea]KGJ88583.1 PEP motif putative anchor domain protein [Colwellia psychrerythraea]
MKKIIMLVTMLLVSINSHATLLSVELNQESYQVGDVLTADFIISDIEEDVLGFQKLLATFDFTLSWDNSVIDYDSSSFGNKLNVGFGGSDQSVFDFMTDSVTLSEVSYAWWDELLPVQDGLSQFVLASVNFDVTNAGTSMLDLTNVIFGDDFGSSFVDVSSTNASFIVNSAVPVDVPEPMTILLMLIAIAVLTRQRKLN